MKRTMRCSLFMAALVALCTSQAAVAQPPCPAGTVLGVTATVGGVVGGSGTLTIRPGGGGPVTETFAGAGVPIDICITCSGVPLAGIPAADIMVAAPGVTFCAVPLANTADTGTDPAGCASFVGTLCGGGCAPALDVFVAGFFVASVAVAINSPDTGISSPGFVDAGDLARFAAALGVPAAYTLCMDYNEDGAIDSGDLAYFAGALGRACGPFACP